MGVANGWREFFKDKAKQKAAEEAIRAEAARIATEAEADALVAEAEAAERERAAEEERRAAENQEPEDEQRKLFMAKENFQQAVEEAEAEVDIDKKADILSKALEDLWKAQGDEVRRVEAVQNEMNERAATRKKAWLDGAPSTRADLLFAEQEYKRAKAERERSGGWTSSIPMPPMEQWVAKYEYDRRQKAREDAGMPPLPPFQG
jgi:hypothetical protein